MSDKGVLRFRQILAKRSKADLEEAALLIARDLGFRYFMFCGRLSQPPGAAHELRFDNFPEAWHRYCADRDRDLLPGSLRRLALLEVTPLPWKKISARNNRPFAKAGEFGLGTGVSCSVRGPHGQWSLTSFGLSRCGPSAERYVHAALPDCQLVACAMHYAAARIARRGPDVAAPGRVKRTTAGILSDRERQVLIQSAGGKTTLEIGQALQISERTAVFHLSNVRRKLGASNSRHAVSKAFSLKLIGAGS
jgi:DNA-binding CsgD family transcriptional regulator